MRRLRSLLTLCLAAQALLIVMLSSAHGQVVRSRPSTPNTASDLLRPPGEQDYENPTDWSTLPAWQQTSFFGVKARGKLFAYVVDASGSMADSGRMLRAKQELRRSIQALQTPQRFVVIFYNDRPMPLAGGLPLAANASSKSHLAAWLRTMGPDGTTDPRSAMAMAIGLQPDAIFLLSDGEFPAGTAQSIIDRNTNQIPIHAIDLSGGSAGGQLKQISSATGGQYAGRP